MSVKQRGRAVEGRGEASLRRREQQVQRPGSTVDTQCHYSTETLQHPKEEISYFADEEREVM